MKLQQDHRTTNPREYGRDHASRITHHASRHHPSRFNDSTIQRFNDQGIALVITLILLSVITFMAVTFLVVSRAEHGSVGITVDSTTARLAADTAGEQAKLRIIGPMLAFTNQFASPDLMVSTNYVNLLGFLNSGPNGAITSPTNVNYDYTYPAKTPLSAADQLRNLGNLLIDPSPPVWMTNVFLRTNESRGYIDLNRNGRFDPSGLLPVMNPQGGYYDLSGNMIPTIQPGNTLSNFFVGDPMWVGILERPGFPHSPTNRFIARYAYLVVPVDKTLDINRIHNYAKALNTGMALTSGDGFLRNQGAGTWEGNLGALLVDLNTNQWQPANNLYRYGWGTNGAPAPYQGRNDGIAFQDALSLLAYRYNRNVNPANILSAAAYFNNPLANDALIKDAVDIYSHGPPMMGSTWVSWPSGGGDYDLPRLDFSWSGSDNKTEFSSLQELYDRNKTASNFGPNINNTNILSFSDRLRFATTNLDSYSRYTAQRLWQILGTESTPEPPNRMNLNRDNLVQSTNGSVSATNFLPWRPVDFFTNAANRLLANAGYTFTCTNIQIYPSSNNVYTPSVQRLLQLAANIYDATTNRFEPALADKQYPYLPSAFRPIFTKIYSTNGYQVFITGYKEITNNASQFINGNFGVFYDMNSAQDLATDWKVDDMVQGVPIIIGAKEGLPNFNSFGAETHVSVTRKLEFRKARGNDDSPNQTNLMYVVGISNTFGLEAWNSYLAAYPRDLLMRVFLDQTVIVTNEFGRTNFVMRASSNAVMVIGANSWQGYPADGKRPTASFRVPMDPATNHFAWMSPQGWSYRHSLQSFIPLTGLFERSGGHFVAPNWKLLLNTRLRYYLVDTKANRLVDAVHINSTEQPVDITDILQRENVNDYGQCGDPYQPDGKLSSMFCTNRGPGVATDTALTYGMRNQIGVSMGRITANVDWSGYKNETPPGYTEQAAKAFFIYNMTGDMTQVPPIPGFRNGIYKTNLFYAPYQPTRDFYVYTSWQANDPLVHYTAGDLQDLNPAKTNQFEFVREHSPISEFAAEVNSRYEPWTRILPNPDGRNLFDLTIKDPLVTRSDDRHFPTNKFPNVGWLGRVHRGSPWQTVFFKAHAIGLSTNDPVLPGHDPIRIPLGNAQTWCKWTGNSLLVTNFGQINTNFVPLYSVVNGEVRGVTNDCLFSHPFLDRYIVDLFTAGINENATRGQMSINQTNLAAWSAILSGAIVLKNTMPDSLLKSGVRATNEPTAIEPAGIYDSFKRANYPPLAAIVEGINRTRNDKNMFSGGAFTRLGDILSVPELTVGPVKNITDMNNITHYDSNGFRVGVSPFINLGNTNDIKRGSNPQSGDPISDKDHVTAQMQYGISEEAYERIPQQILGLLKMDDSPRFMIYAYGQTLKPAPKSVITSGAWSGLVTNYQVTAEVATRSVLRIEGNPDPARTRPVNQFDPKNVYPLKVMLESFNILPPD